MLWLNLLGTEICLWRPVITSNINDFTQKWHQSDGGTKAESSMLREAGVTLDLKF